MYVTDQMEVNMSQAELAEDVLDYARSKDPRLDSYEIKVIANIATPMINYTFTRIESEPVQ